MNTNVKICGETANRMDIALTSFHLKANQGVGWGKDGYAKKPSYADRSQKGSPKHNLKIEPDKDHSKKKKSKLRVK